MAERREIEDLISARLGLTEQSEGTASFGPLKIASRIETKVDAEEVQRLAAEHGLESHLAALFRWKPEINVAAWKAADEAITKPLLDAITATPGRPSFTISKKG